MNNMVLVFGIWTGLGAVIIPLAFLFDAYPAEGLTFVAFVAATIAAVYWVAA